MVVSKNAGHWFVNFPDTTMNCREAAGQMPIPLQARRPGYETGEGVPQISWDGQDLTSNKLEAPALTAAVTDVFLLSSA